MALLALGFMARSACGALFPLCAGSALRRLRAPNWTCGLTPLQMDERFLGRIHAVGAITPFSSA
ncbi:MAG: hypothetical protein M5R42_01925 [Rhodocyclaceae bacterium]|nr:hypothetical protein [Rhodocyclaceae bacterium]